MHHHDYSASKRRGAFALLVLLLLASCQSEPTESGSSRKARTLDPATRSIVLVTVDTTRPDRLEPYGSTNVKTPALSRLASRGVVFERAWAVAPITLVAHTSILSGQYPFQHGVRNNGTQYVSESVETLAEVLEAEGYRTGAFVSAAVLDDRYGLDQGFEVYDDDLSDRRNLSPRMVADRPAGPTIDAALAWLDSLDGDEPYFTWIHLYDPHASYSPPPPFRDEYRGRLYDGEIAYMDQQIGRLMRHPKVLGDGEDEPIFVVLGDHGESLGEHGERTHAILAYDSTIQVPFLLYVPDGPAGLRVREAVGQVDLMPTLLSLVDLDVPTGPEMSGRDLVPVLEGRPGNPLHAYYSETFLPFYTYGWAKLKVLHRERWKFIDSAPAELYDRVRDPRELTNVHEQESGAAHDMKRDLDEWLSGFDADREAALSLDSDALAKLRSLGYLSVGSGSAGPRSGPRPNPMEMIGQHVGLERSRTLLADRLYDPAVRQLESVLRRDPGNLAAHIDLSRAHEGRGDYDEAVRIAERALELDPEYTQTYMILARLEAFREDLDRALELSVLAADRDPNNPEPRVQQALFLDRLGRRPEAEAVLEGALGASPEHSRVNSVYAHLVEARHGELDAAAERLKKVVERDPFFEQAWFFLGQIHERQGLTPTAIESYQRGLKSRPDAPDLHAALGHVFARMGKAAEAEVQLREAIRLSPRMRSELHVSLGGVLAEMGRADEAKVEYDKVLKANPDHPGARNNAAIALYRSGRIEEANSELQEVVAQFPRHADAHNNLAAIAVDQEQWSDAVRYSRKTLELAPGVVEAWNNLAIGLEGLGDLGEARAAYSRALELDPEYWPAYFNLGFMLKKSGQHDAAEAALQEVLLRVPNHDETHLELGELYEGPLEDRTRARVHWNAFLKHGSAAHPRRGEILGRLSAL